MNSLLLVPPPFAAVPLPVPSKQPPSIRPTRPRQSRVCAILRRLPWLQLEGDAAPP